MPACPPITLIADSGSSGNFATFDLPVLNKRPTSTQPITIQLPNGDQVFSTHEAELDLPMLLPDARHMHLVPGLHNCLLLSIGQLCDAGYDVHFTRTHMHVLIDGCCIIQGHRSTTTKLWHVPSTTGTAMPTSPPSYPTHSAATAIGTHKAADLVAFAHATLFSPALSTLEKALSNGFLTNFPGLTFNMLHKHPPQSIATIKGHLDQTRQNQRSTKIIAAPMIPANVSIPSPDNNDCTTDMHPLGIDTPTNMHVFCCSHHSHWPNII